MPELPEVETTRQGILPFVENQSVISAQLYQGQLRWPVTPGLCQKIKQQRVQALSRRGKYLVFHFEHGALLSHLGMSGKWYLAEDTTPIEKHTHFTLRLSSGKHLRYVDPRRFGALLWTDQPIEQHRLIAALGPEPLSHQFTARYLLAQSKKRSKPVKTFIMDSKIVVGVGNIYANEALFHAKIHPNTAAGSLTLSDYKNLVTAIKSTLRAAIKQGGTTLKDFHNGNNQPGYFKQSLAVYGRGAMPCLECGNKLTQVKIGQRQTVFCGNCQG